MKWYIGVLKKYAVFSGRACPKEYWMFVLFNLLNMIALCIIGGILLSIFGTSGEESANINTYSVAQSICTLYTLAFIIPGIAVTVRRLHDTNRSGWWILLGPFGFGIGLIVLLAFMVQEGQTEDNQYGPNPILPTKQVASI